jgi:hypothetical protein
MTPLEAVQRAIDLLHELEQAPAGDQDIADGRLQVWALFDRDQHPCVPQAFAAARRTAVHVAFSHPSFDLWLLLHFQNLSSAEGGSSRVVNTRLRAAHPAYAAFAVNGEKSVTGARAQALLGREDQAAGHARRLVDDCPSEVCSAAAGHAGECQPLTRDPSTDVWWLLEALRIV